MPCDLLQDTSQCIGTDPSGHKLTTKNFVRKRFNFDVWVVVCVSERDSPKPCECCTVCHNIDMNMWTNWGNVYTRYGSEQNVYCDVWKNDTNRRKNLRCQTRRIVFRYTDPSPSVPWLDRSLKIRGLRTLSILNYLYFYDKLTYDMRDHVWIYKFCCKYHKRIQFPRENEPSPGGPWPRTSRGNLFRRANNSKICSSAGSSSSMSWRDHQDCPHWITLDIFYNIKYLFISVILWHVTRQCILSFTMFITQVAIVAIVRRKMFRIQMTLGSVNISAHFATERTEPRLIRIPSQEL